MLLERNEISYPIQKSQSMLCCCDVAYGHDRAVAAAVFFHDWADPSATGKHWVESTSAAGYKPGEFYRRELPILSRLLETHRPKLKTIIVDGYVWLDHDRPGLGHYLYEEFECEIPVVGIAKNSFKDNGAAVSVLRGKSQKPLWVTAVGCEAAQAARSLQSMHGPFRIPTLLKAADTLCREKLKG